MGFPLSEGVPLERGRIRRPATTVVSVDVRALDETGETTPR